MGASRMPVRVDLNCDMEESFGAYTIGVDELVMPLITSANIACGFHAGDPLVMRRTVRLAREHGVAVGEELLAEGITPGAPGTGPGAQGAAIIITSW